MTQDHAGHRERMRDKFLRHGSDVFDTYELLEMLLYSSVPQKDTNPIAKSLLAKFSSLDGVFRATAEELLSVPEVGERTVALLCSAGVAGMIPSLLKEGKKKEILDDRDKIRDYLIGYFAGRQERSVIMLSLDNRLSLLAVDEVYQKDFCCGSIQPSLFVKIAVRRGASVVILAHNHPNAIPFPTGGDSENELALRKEMKNAAILYPLHFIISGDSAFEFPHGDDTLRSDAGRSLLTQCSERLEFSKLTEGLRIDGTVTEQMLYYLFLVPFGRERAEEIARSLSASFPALSHILEARADLLVRKAGLKPGEAFYFRLVLAVFLRRSTESFRFGKKYCEQEILRYLCARFLDRGEETVFLLPTDEKGRILGEELLYIGAVNGAQFLPRKIMDFAERYGAKGIILAHNHPSGSADSSPSDMTAAEDLSAILSEVGIRLIASYTVAGYEYSDAVIHPKEKQSRKENIL